MNYRFLIGHSLNVIVNKILSNSYFPLTRYIPKGIYPLYDIQFFSGTRKLQTVFDVGANIGQTARGFIQYFPNSQIYCFEPVSQSFRTLSQNFSEFPNVHCINKGLGSNQEIIKINLYKDSQLDTLIKNGPREDQKIGEEEISLDSLDNFCNSQKIRYIDLLKMDVQGWESEVLRGASSFLDSRRIHFILTEVGFRNSDSDMQHFSEINSFLEENGFWLCGFYHSFRWGDRKQYLGFSNALYIQPEFLTNAHEC